MQLSNKIERTTTLGNVLLQIENNKKRIEFSEIRSFDKQAHFSILFHKCIYEEYLLEQPQSDRLDYLFSANQTLDSILESATEILNNAIIPTEVFRKPDNKLALLQLTREAIINIRLWSDTFKNKLWSQTAELPRSLKISKERIFLDNDTFPKKIKKLSVFTLCTLQFSPSEIEKIEKLHLFGLRNIGNLVLLNPKYKIF